MKKRNRIGKNAGLALAIVALTVGAPPAALAGSCSASQKDIVDTAAKAGGFETLIAAAKAAGLAEALKGDGPLTVFAPTDEAFAKLPRGTVESLLKPENRERLAAILTYHVAPEALPASKVAAAGRIETLNGQHLAVTVEGGTVMVGNATVTATDIQASNGIIHVIDQVILPPEERSAVDGASRGWAMLRH